MQIVIDISKRIYDHILRTNMLVNSDRLEVTKAIIDGTPLPKGHWIEVEDNGKILSYQCSCGCAYKQNFNFCPNCGADMRGAE